MKVVFRCITLQVVIPPLFTSWVKVTYFLFNIIFHFFIYLENVSKSWFIYIFQKYAFFRALSSLTTWGSNPPPCPHLKKMWVPKDAQCSETNFWVPASFFLRISVFKIWFIFYSTSFVVNWELKRFLRTWFRYANQWYPITSWLGGFNPKASGACGWSPRWRVWRAKPLFPPRNGGLRGRAAQTCILFWILSSPRPIHYECWVQNRPYLKN